MSFLRKNFLTIFFVVFSTNVLAMAELADKFDLAKMGCISTNLRGATFVGAVLKNATIRGQDLNEVDFRDADLTDADLSFSLLIGMKINSNTKIEGLKAWVGDIGIVETNKGPTLFPLNGKLQVVDREWLESQGVIFYDE